MIPDKGECAWTAYKIETITYEVLGYYDTYEEAKIALGIMGAVYSFDLCPSIQVCDADEI